MVEKLKSITNQPIMLCSPTVRLPLKRFIERRLPHVTVLSYGDMTSDVEIKSIGLLRLEPQLQTA
jgi:flagellar biosynthesis protein FlhA